MGRANNNTVHKVINALNWGTNIEFVFRVENKTGF